MEAMKCSYRFRLEALKYSLFAKITQSNESITKRRYNVLSMLLAFESLKLCVFLYFVLIKNIIFYLTDIKPLGILKIFLNI